MDLSLFWMYFCSFPCISAKKWLCLGFHSWRAILGLSCFHLFYFKITKAFQVIFGFAIHSSLCFTKTIKPTLSKCCIEQNGFSPPWRAERTEPVRLINISREIVSFPELVLVKGCWPVVWFHVGLLTPDPTWTSLWLSQRHLPTLYLRLLSSQLFSLHSCWPGPCQYFLRTRAMKNQDVGFLNERFQC